MAKTIFILGAGASYPYGFPLGSSLINDILDRTKITIDTKSGELLITNNLLKILITEFSEVHIKNFRKQLEESELYSIDAFLSHNHQFLKIGKACIAYIIFEYERKSITENKLKGDWYRYFWNVLSSEVPDNFDFKIYTFNYDRSLSYYLFTKSKETFSNDKEKHLNYFKNIPIIYLHGNLGRIDYGEIGIISDYTHLEYVANHIKIIFEVQADTNFEELKLDIKNAQHIVFLGFGFHPDNVKRLGFPDLKFTYPNPMFYASTLGMLESEIETRFLNYIKKLNCEDGSTTHYTKPPAKYKDAVCLLFLREKFPFQYIFKS